MCLEGPASISWVSASCCSSQDGTLAWNFVPTLVAALGKIRSSGSTVSSARVYKLALAKNHRTDLPKVSKWPAAIGHVGSVGVGSTTSRLFCLDSRFGSRRSGAGIVELLLGHIFTPLKRTRYAYPRITLGRFGQQRRRETGHMVMLFARPLTVQRGVEVGHTHSHLTDS